MSNRLFEKIRQIAAKLGISTPESNDDIYKLSLFNLIDKRIVQIYEEYDTLNMAAMNKDNRIKLLETELRKHKQFCEEVLCGYESTKFYQSTTELLAKSDIVQ